MILNVKVENFRSIRDKAEFSMVAATDTHLVDHLIDLPSNLGKVIRTAGFYGPNASGKSNFLRAFAALNYLIDDSGMLREGEQINCYEPYLLSNSTKTATVKFEVEFIVSDLKYQYTIEFNKYSIVKESLDCFYTKIPSNLFFRDDSGWENIKFGSSFKGGNKKIPFFPNNSYLSKIGNTAGAPESVKSVYEFFTQKMKYLDSGQTIDSSHVKKIDKADSFKKITGDFLSLVDTGINDITIEERDVSYLKFPDNMSDELKEHIIMENKYEFMFGHKTIDGENIYLGSDDESDGTMRLFDLTPALVASFISNRVFIIDEIDHHLHPHIAELILKLFNDSEVNKFNSQLIFSTHNIGLMKPSKMRRDQIWFSEKENGVTNIFSLDDFEKDKVKVSTPFNKWYDEGRFGGTPNLDFIKIKNYFIELNKKVEKINSEKLDSSEKSAELNSSKVFGNLDNLPKFE